MSSAYEEELGTSILLVYCSDNDCPDKVFPADPRLVQAHMDAQNEPRPPPTPPGSPVSGISTPSSVMLFELWEMERSSTPSPTFDVSEVANPMLTQKQGIEAPLEIGLSQLSIDQDSHDSSLKKKAVSFSLRIELIEYRPSVDNKQFKRFMDKIKKKDKKKNEKMLKANEEMKGSRFWQTKKEDNTFIKKVASLIGVTPTTKVYRKASMLVHHVKSFSSRIVS